MGLGGGAAGLDPHRTAELLIHHHGRRAVRIAATRANKLAEEGDREGAMEWLRISEEVLRQMKAAEQA